MDSIFSKSSSKRIGVYFESSDLREKKQKQRLVLLKAKHNSEMASLCIRYGSTRMLINRMYTLTSAKIFLSKQITSFHWCGIVLWEGSGFSRPDPTPRRERNHLEQPFGFPSSMRVHVTRLTSKRQITSLFLLLKETLGTLIYNDATATTKFYFLPKSGYAP